MNKELAMHAAEILKAVAHPLRLQIVEVLAENERSVGEIAKVLGEKQAITSQQLALMKDKGVLTSRREGARVYYRIRNRSVVRVLNCVHDHCEPGTKVRGRR